MESRLSGYKVRGLGRTGHLRTEGCEAPSPKSILKELAPEKARAKYKGHEEECLSPLLYQDKIPHIGDWGRVYFSPCWRLGRPRSRCQSVWHLMRALFMVAEGCPLAVSSHGRKGAS